MGEPYYRYPAAAAAADRGSVSRPSFHGYLSSEEPSLASHHADMQVASSDVQKKDKNQLQPGRYGVDDITNSRVYPELCLGGESAGATNRNRDYPSSLGEPNLIAQRWDAPVGVSSSGAVHFEPSAIRGYPYVLEVPSSVGHRPDAHDISPSAGVHPESTLGAISAAATIRGYPSAPEVPNLVCQRWDALVGISPNAGLQPEPNLGAVSARTSIKGYSSPLEDPNLVGQRRDVPIGINPSAGLRPEPSLGAVSAGASIYTSDLEDPDLVSQRQDGPLGIRHGIPDASDEKPASVRSPPDAAEESNILFVDGLPTDCTRREVGHLFRPFHGYKEIKVIHKEPRHSGDKAMVLCFVEFEDSKFAMTAMQALQGYIFDDKKPNSPALRIQFAHFPFQFRADHHDQRVEFRH